MLSNGMELKGKKIFYTKQVYKYDRENNKKK